MRKNSHSLYLLSFTQTWALTRNVQFLQTKLKPYLSRMDLGDVVWTLTPIHVNGNHWGLLCLNITQHQAFYDDGLKQSPPTNIIELADNLLKAVSETQWNITFPIQRFGMPKQPLFGEGWASCGICVTLAVWFHRQPCRQWNSSLVLSLEFSWYGESSPETSYRFTQRK